MLEAAMRIVSSPLPAEPSDLVDGRPTVVMALATLVDQKSLIVGLVQGVMEGPNLQDVRVSPVGQLVMERCDRYHRLNYPDAPALVAGVAQVGNAVKRVRQVLSEAPPNALVVLLCANGKVYDAAYNALCIDLKSANVGAQ